MYVLLEGFILLLQGLSINVTDVAFIVFIIVEFFTTFSQSSKSIQQQSRNDVPEQHTEENRIYCIISESLHFK